ncbi:MAG: DUF4446 family protein [Clostridiaceae bacterium]|nr:DUF4446 family protein [Clostridiaceae bacterium]
MEEIFKILRSDMSLVVLVIIIIILFLLYISNSIKLSKLRKNYKKFIKKLGNGNNIDEMLKEYINSVEKVQKENKEINEYCKDIDENMSKCLQKVGMVRYNAFQDTGSDLSFALAILDENDNGVVLNGIYSREMSNIYAKTIINGESQNTLSKEEKEAIEKAINKK